jgi:hypothetical protein
MLASSPAPLAHKPDLRSRGQASACEFESNTPAADDLRASAMPFGSLLLAPSFERRPESMLLAICATGGARLVETCTLSRRHCGPRLCSGARAGSTADGVRQLLGLA